MLRRRSQYGGYTAGLFKNAIKADRFATLTIDALEVEHVRRRMPEHVLRGSGSNSRPE